MTEERPRAYLEPMTVRGRIARPQPKGLPVIGMGYNELPYGPSPHVMAAIEAAARDGNRYGPPGCDAVREALGEVHGLDAEAIAHLDQVLEIFPDLAQVYSRRAQLHASLADYKNAIADLDQYLGLSKEDSNHPDVVHAFNLRSSYSQELAKRKN